MKRIVLASKSPRRKQLLKERFEEFDVDVSDVVETFPNDILKVDVPVYLAKLKAEDVFKRNNDALVIGADTVVIINDQILGKPIDKADAINMISMLSGNTHIVVTGVCLKCSEYIKTFSCITEVTFKKMSNEEIIQYCELNSIYDKAGAYAIQEDAAKYIVGIKGDYNNVVGLPTEMIKQYIK